MWHWRLSSSLGLLLSGRFKPVCAIVYGLPDCAARRAFLRLMDRVFAESQHCRKIWTTYHLGRAIR